MITENTSSGYIMLSRSIEASGISKKPHHYFRIWLYLLLKAQHTDYKGLKRGQLFTSMPEIIEATSWYVGCRKEKLSKDQVFQVLEWLRKPDGDHNGAGTAATMITTTKATHGMLITICNYNYYQNPTSYESNAGGNGVGVTKATGQQRQADNINKNGNNENNDKNENRYSSAVAEDRELISFYQNEVDKTKPTSIATFIREKSPRFHQPYMDLWNLFASKQGVKPIKYFTPTRKRKLAARLREPEFDLFEILMEAKKSEFLKGENDRGWTFSFDWIIGNADNYLKIKEGLYLQKKANDQDKAIVATKIRHSRANQEYAKRLNDTVEARMVLEDLVPNSPDWNKRRSEVQSIVVRELAGELPDGYAVAEKYKIDENKKKMNQAM